MLRASFPGLAASAAAPFAAFTAGSLGKKKTSGALSLKPLHRSLTSASSTSTSTSPATKLAALSSRDPPPAPRLDFQPDSLTGRWHKLKSESDDMRAACDAVELNKILRMGVGFVNTLDIVDERRQGGGRGGKSGNGTEAHFATTLKAGGILDVRERYPWSGAQVQHSRRDKRRGRHSGRVSLVEAPEVGGVGVGIGGGAEGEGAPGESKRLHPRITVTWDDPLGGECIDTFVLSRCGRILTQLSVLRVRGREAVVYKTVYTR